jgi:hypothetical protein
MSKMREGLAAELEVGIVIEAAEHTAEHSAVACGSRHTAELAAELPPLHAPLHAPGHAIGDMVDEKGQLRHRTGGSMYDTWYPKVNVALNGVGGKIEVLPWI